LFYINNLDIAQLDRLILCQLFTADSQKLSGWSAIAAKKTMNGVRSAIAWSGGIADQYVTPTTS
jgi:hypothetical protein